MNCQMAEIQSFYVLLRESINNIQFGEAPSHLGEHTKNFSDNKDEFQQVSLFYTFQNHSSSLAKTIGTLKDHKKPWN